MEEIAAKESLKQMELDAVCAVEDEFSKVKIEKEFPFHGVHIKALQEKVNAINKDLISIDELAAALNTPEWAGKFAEGSDLIKLLESLPNSGKGNVDKVALLALSILWCEG